MKKKKRTKGEKNGQIWAKMYEKAVKHIYVQSMRMGHSL